MALFGFWNVRALHDTSWGKRSIPRLVAEFATERSLDAVFLIECSVPISEIIGAFGDDPEYYPVESGERFSVLVRFDPKYITRLSPVIPSNRFDLWRLKLPLQEEVILTLIHGPDKRNNKELDQSLFFDQVVSAITYFENELKHERSVVFGDLNANPFESSLASLSGMNAVMSRQISLKMTREKFGKTYKYFYNPMWGLYGDEPRTSVPATFYFNGSSSNELYWHMLDQVLIRPTLVDAFKFDSLEIVISIGGASLLRTNGTPNGTKFSDHLPVIFEVDLVNL